MAWTPEERTEFTDKALQRIAAGESMADIGRDPEMPSATTIYDWIDADEEGELSERYARARQRQAEHHASEILAIADDNSEDVQRSRLRVDARKWIASKLKPATYGEKMQHSGDAGGSPIRVVVSKEDNAL